MNAEREPIAPNRVILSNTLESREVELNFGSKGSHVEISQSFQMIGI